VDWLLYSHLVASSGQRKVTVRVTYGCLLNNLSACFHLDLCDMGNIEICWLEGVKVVLKKIHRCYLF